ncbi:MAG: hypothetical protein ACJ8CB_32975 [Ktedonobacteraceae bacterium]
MDEQTTGPTVSRLDLLFLTRAYNRHEITLTEWMRLSKAWAEAMERQYSGGSNRTPSMPSRTPEGLG